MMRKGKFMPREGVMCVLRGGLRMVKWQDVSVGAWTVIWRKERGWRCSDYDLGRERVGLHFAMKGCVLKRKLKL